MYFDLALVCAAVTAGRWGWFYARRGRSLFGGMQLGAAALSVLALIGERQGEGKLPGILGAIGLGASVCLLLIGPWVRRAGRAAAQAERFTLADRLLDIADVMQPGAGASEEKLALLALRRVQGGDIDEAISALQLAQSRAPVDNRRAFDERIAMLYLSAERYEQAVQFAERTLLAEPAAASNENVNEFSVDEMPVGGDGTVIPSGAWSDVSRSLGVMPPLFVELMSAYARRGDLDRAAAMVLQLEAAIASRGDSYWMRHRARLVFLAWAGEQALVAQLLTRAASRHLSRSARAYWTGVAAWRAGDGVLARNSMRAAAAQSNGRARRLANTTLTTIEATDVHAAVHLSAPVVQAISQLKTPLTPPAIRARRGYGVTISLIAANLAVAVIVAIVVGKPGDVGVVVRAGGALRGAIEAGEWWRLISCQFVHVGWLHLIVNLLGLWGIGRWAETLFGRARMLSIYAAAGCAGALASYLGSEAGVAAGASGAVFGLIGAMFIELMSHRARYVAAWRSGLAGSLLVVTVAQLGIGFMFPAIDQWAHGGGLVAGIVVGAAMSPFRPWARVLHRIAIVITAAYLAAVGMAAYMVVRTDFAATLAAYPDRAWTLPAATLTAPARWTLDDGELADPDLYIVLGLHPLDPSPANQALDVLDRAEFGRAKERGFSDIITAQSARFTWPAGFRSIELVASAEDPLGSEQRYRVLLGVGVPSSTPTATPIGIVIYVPEALLDGAAERLRSVISSIHVTAPPSP